RWAARSRASRDGTGRRSVTRPRASIRSTGRGSTTHSRAGDCSPISAARAARARVARAWLARAGTWRGRGRRCSGRPTANRSGPRGAPPARPRTRGSAPRPGRGLTRAWPVLLRATYGESFAIARDAARLLTYPRFLPLAGPVGMRSQALMSAAVRCMSNTVADSDRDVVARAWRAAGSVARRLDRQPLFDH